MKSGIYKITNKITGKFYIGSTKDIDKRWYDHKRELQLNIHKNPKLQHSWNFYGEDKFEFLILEEIEPDQIKLFEREQYYLDTFKPHMRGIGYNISSTANGGDNITNHPNRDKFIEKMSEICSGENNPMFGRNHTEESIKKQKEKAKGRYSLEWFINRYGKIEGEEKYKNRKEMLERRNINYVYDNGLKGIKRGKLSEKTRKKISDSKLRIKQIKHLIIEDIKSNLYSIKALSKKYDIGTNIIKYYKRKIRSGLE